MREIVEKAVIEEAAGRLTEEDLHKLESNLAAQEVCYRNKNYLEMLGLDDEFHGTIFRACGKERTYEMVKQLNIDLYRLRVLRLSHDFRWDQILNQHRQILQALREGKEKRPRGSWASICAWSLWKRINCWLITRNILWTCKEAW